MAKNKKTGNEYYDGFYDDKENGEVLFFRSPKGIWGRKLSPDAIAVYCYLMDCVNWEKWNDGRVFPKRETIIEQSGVTKYKLSSAVQELVEDGWINNIVERMNDSNVYFMNVVRKPNEDLIVRRNLKAEGYSKLQKELCENKPAPEKGKKYLWKKVENNEVVSENEPPYCT
jgi:hypothetical protein